MEKRLFLILFFMGVFISVYSQSLVVTGFELKENDLTAQRPRYERLDYNNNPCGLVKIGLPIREATFESMDIIHKYTEYKDGEWWVYMIDGSQRITIKAPDYPPLRYTFSEPIRGGQTYIMTVERPADPNAINNSSALLRSAFVPGWGQFYKDRNGRGTLIVIGETLTLAAGGLSLYNELNQKSIMDKPEVSYQDYIAAEKSYEQWNTARHISFITAAVIYSLNLVDAYLTPTKSQNNIVFTPNVMNTNGEMAVGATLSIRF